MLIELLTIFLLAAIPAAFSYFLDFCLGRPGSNEPNTRAVFFEYIYTLAIQRIRKEGLYRGLRVNFEAMIGSDNQQTRKDGVQQFRVAVVLTAQKYVTWEQPLGFCLYCSNFWFSLIASAVMFFFVPLHHIDPILFFVIVPVISHTILRKL